MWRWKIITEVSRINVAPVAKMPDEFLYAEIS